MSKSSDKRIATMRGIPLATEDDLDWAIEDEYSFLKRDPHKIDADLMLRAFRCIAHYKQEAEKWDEFQSSVSQGMGFLERITTLEAALRALREYAPDDGLDLEKGIIDRALTQTEETPND